jgi:hypothetical protein
MMNWIIPASDYQVWTDFKISFNNDLSLTTGNIYSLKGNNGSGKSSFIRKILIPYLQKNPQNQYVMYIEQQVQSQLDAVKSYTAMQKPPVRIETTEEMTTWLMANLKDSVQKAPRPVFLILDECSISNINLITSGFEANQICFLYVSHCPCEFMPELNQHIIEFKLLNQYHSFLTNI